MQLIQSRRGFLAGLSAFGASTLAGRKVNAEEGLPETSSVRLPIFPKVTDCQAAMYIAGDLLRGEGFTDVEFVGKGTGADSWEWLVHNEIDFDWNFPPAHIRAIAEGASIKFLTGLHAGCLELIANDAIHAVSELKGKRVGVDIVDGSSHVLLKVMTAYVGIQPDSDIVWVRTPDPFAAFDAGEIDAFLAGPPQPQIAHERNQGRVILKTAFDRPWSQYYCCMLAVTSAYAQQNPIATKRVLRALLKAVDLCVSDPEGVTKQAVALGVASRDDYQLQTFADARFDVWREYDPEDTVRFYALRMQETGLLNASPQDIIAAGTDWSFLDQIKREMKG